MSFISLEHVSKTKLVVYINYIQDLLDIFNNHTMFQLNLIRT